MGRKSKWLFEKQEVIAALEHLRKQEAFLREVSEIQTEETLEAIKRLELSVKSLPRRNERTVSNEQEQVGRCKLL